MTSTRRGHELDDWLDKTEAVNLPHLRALANGLRRDHAAVTAGLTLPHNSGAVEGTVNITVTWNLSGVTNSSKPKTTCRMAATIPLTDDERAARRRRPGSTGPPTRPPRRHSDARRPAGPTPRELDVPATARLLPLVAVRQGAASAAPRRYRDANRLGRVPQSLS